MEYHKRLNLVAATCLCLAAAATACYVESTMRYGRSGHSSVAEEVEGKENDEKRLLRHLMKGYERDVRPVRNASTPIVIQLSMTLTQIFDMDEKNQVLTTIIWLDQEWKDELLTWDPEEFGGLKVLRMPCERIWLPDIVLYNNADDYTRGYMNSKAMVSHDGNVFWPPPTKLRSTCPVDVTYFPFDDQTCVLKLGSWTYDGFQVDVTNRTSEVDLTNYVPNGEWELLEARLIRNVVFYSCCPEPFPDLTVTLKIRRKTLYYMYNIVLPCMMMSVLTLLVFCLPPESGEKIALGVTVLLAFSVFMLAIAEKMPETSESIPLIGIYLTAVMAITSISVVMTVIVLNYHYKGPTSRQVPDWMRRYLLRLPPRRLAKTSSSQADGLCRAYGEAEAGRFLSNGKGATSSEYLACSGIDGYRNSSVSTIPLSTAPSCQASSSASTFRLRMAEMNSKAAEPDAKRSLIRLGAKFNHHIHHERHSQSDEDDTAESVLSVNPSSHHHLLAAADAVGVNSRASVTSLDVTGAIMSNAVNDAAMATCCHHQDNSGLRADTSKPREWASDHDNLLRYFLDRQKGTETGQTVVNEWRQVAAAVDRILFWVFCVITSVSSALFLLIIPGINRGWFTTQSRFF